MKTIRGGSRHRSRAWLAGLAGVVALVFAGLLTACGYSAASASSAYVGVCTDSHTGIRVPDIYCGGADPYTGAALDSGGYLWDYYPPSYSGLVAGYGQRVVGVTIIHTVPATTSTHVVVIDRGAAASGGSVTSVRARAAASHSQVTEKPTPTTGAGRTPSRSTAPRTSTPTRNSSITRGGFGVPRRSR